MHILTILFGIIMVSMGLFLFITMALFFLGLAFYFLLQFAILAELFVIAASVRNWRFYGLLIIVSLCGGFLWQQPNAAKAVLPLVLASVAPLRLLVSAYLKQPGYWMSRNSGYKVGVAISTGISVAIAFPLIAKSWSELTAGGM